MPPLWFCPLFRACTGPPMPSAWEPGLMLFSALLWAILLTGVLGMGRGNPPD